MSKLKMLSWCVFCLCFATGGLCLAQIDIYQSDAYSLEEMCARQAEQETTMDYNDAYESCITDNSDNPMYQADQNNADVHHSESSDSGGTDQSHSQNQSDLEFPQDLEKE